MPAIYQTFTGDEVTSRGNVKSTLMLTSNSGREDNVRTILPGQQGRGIRRESVFLRYNYQTTAKNPIAKNPTTYIGNSPYTRSKIKVKI